MPDKYDTSHKPPTSKPSKPHSPILPILLLATDNCSGWVRLCYSFVSWRSPVVVVHKVAAEPGPGCFQSCCYLTVTFHIRKFWDVSDISGVREEREGKEGRVRYENANPTVPPASKKIPGRKWQNIAPEIKTLRDVVQNFPLPPFRHASMPLCIYASGIHGYLHAASFLSVNSWTMLLLLPLRLLVNRYHISYPHEPAEKHRAAYGISGEFGMNHPLFPILRLNLGSTRGYLQCPVEFTYYFLPSFGFTWSIWNLSHISLNQPSFCFWGVW